MALWGAKDNIGAAAGTVGLNYSTKTVTGSGTTFGDTDSIQVGDIIRFGDMTDNDPDKYFGDAVVLTIASNTSLTIASTESLSGAAIAATTYTASQLPKSTTWDDDIAKLAGSASTITRVYGLSDASSTASLGGQYESGSGWVGVTTYLDNTGALRVKKEVLVAMSGITTGNVPTYPDGL